MTRFEAYQILTTNLKNQSLIKHSLAAEAAMRGLCVYLLKNPDSATIDKWGIVGMLHDADYELSFDKPEKHGILITERVQLAPDIARAIQAHNWQRTKIMPETPMEWAIASCDQLTGLIVAAALIHPSKKITEITPEFVMKRFYEKSFAKGADRASIETCETKLNIPLIKFIEIVLYSVREVSQNLGL